MARYRVGLATRERILAATLAVLSEQGLESTTLKSITDRAGVGAGSFYNLFASKEEAVWEILSNAIAAVDPDPQALGSETSTDLVNAFVQFVTGDDAVLSRIYLQLASTAPTDDDIAARMARAQQRRVDRFHAALSREHPDLDDGVVALHAELLVAALTGLTVRQGYDPSFDFARHARLLDTDPSRTAGRMEQG
ncbi:MAG TPA: TetR/AcrR family transcriptional regulator [Nitriliruptoraceae bacterium]|nr:TetR/AcrR family transcriptional regulator [Nitriliruptoraceae bacterium]